eukprot:6542641-Pyramimonas_sp.AAC.1
MRQRGDGEPISNIRGLGEEGAPQQVLRAALGRRGGTGGPCAVQDGRRPWAQSGAKVPSGARRGRPREGPTNS